jgi:hypothetical protein
MKNVDRPAVRVAVCSKTAGPTEFSQLVKAGRFKSSVIVGECCNMEVRVELSGAVKVSEDGRGLPAMSACLRLLHFVIAVTGCLQQIADEQKSNADETGRMKVGVVYCR